jgi:apolipoprotein N-acyltransferase
VAYREPLTLNWLQFVVAALELPPNPRERHFWGRLAVLQLIYSLAGLLFGLACIVGGILLFFHGVAGSSSWVGEFIGVQSKLSDAAPGTVLFVVGLAVVWLTRFAVRVKQPIDIEVRARVEAAGQLQHERREHERREHARRRKAG